MPLAALPVVVSKEPAAPPPSGGELGEDMLQMALRMASEMSDEPVMDLENSLEPVAVSSGKYILYKLHLGNTSKYDVTLNLLKILEQTCPGSIPGSILHKSIAENGQL